MYIEMDCPCQGKNLDKLLQPLILCILAKGGDMHRIRDPEGDREGSLVSRIKRRTLRGSIAT